MAKNNVISNDGSVGLHEKLAALSPLPINSPVAVAAPTKAALVKKSFVSPLVVPRRPPITDEMKNRVYQLLKTTHLFVCNRPGVGESGESLQSDAKGMKVLYLSLKTATFADICAAVCRNTRVIEGEQLLELVGTLYAWINLFNGLEREPDAAFRNQYGLPPLPEIARVAAPAKPEPVPAPVKSVVKQPIATSPAGGIDQRLQTIKVRSSRPVASQPAVDMLNNMLFPHASPSCECSFEDWLKAASFSEVMQQAFHRRALKPDERVRQPKDVFLAWEKNAGREHIAQVAEWIAEHKDDKVTVASVAEIEREKKDTQEALRRAAAASEKPKPKKDKKAK